MKVWILKDSEPLAIDEGQPRLMRNGMFSQALANAGHEVRWFTSNFSHYQKRHRDCGEGPLPVRDGLILEMLAGPGYSSNRSPKRYLHNWVVARQFNKRARAIAWSVEDRPDVIVGDIPTPEMALLGVRLAREWNIPSVICVRDLWPDFFASFLPRPVTWAAGPVLKRMNRDVRSACSQAESIVGISEGYLDWGLRKAGRSRRKSDVIIPLGYSPQPGTSGAQAEGIRRRLANKGVEFTRSLAIFIGSWGITYDLDLLINAAAELSDNENIQIVIAGGGEQAAKVLGKTGSMRNVTCPGWLDRDEIAFLLNESCVGLSPYRNTAPQGMPNKVFEYMSAGLFQVTTLDGEAAGLFAEEQLGQSVQSGEPKAFAKAIAEGVEAHNEPGAKERVRNYFDQHFDADRVYSDYVCHLESLVESRVS